MAAKADKDAKAAKADKPDETAKADKPTTRSRPKTPKDGVERPDRGDTSKKRSGGKATGKKRKSAFKLDLPEPAADLLPDEDSSIEDGLPVVPRRARRWPAVLALALGAITISFLAVYGIDFLDQSDQEATLAALESGASEQAFEQLEFRVKRLPESLRDHPRVLAVLEAARERAADEAAREKAARILRRIDPRGEPSERRKQVEQALRIAPRSVEALLLAARLAEIEGLAKAGEVPIRSALADALGLAYRAESQAPKSPEVALTLGLLRLRSGDSSAKLSFRDAIKRGPHTVSGRIARGELALLEGTAGAAEDGFESALSLEEGNPRALRGRGEARRRLGLLPEARADAIAAAAGDPWSVDARLLLARITLGKGGDWRPLSKAAKDEFERAIAAVRRLYPSEPSALALTALLRIRLTTAGDLEAEDAERGRAHKEASQAVENDPNQAAGWAVLATLARGTGKRAEAERCLKAGLPHANSNARAKRLLLVVRVRLTNTPALSDLDAIVALAPREPYGLLLRARALRAENKLAQACRDISRVLKSAPERKDLYVLRAEWRLGLKPPQVAAAIADLDTYLSSAPTDSDVLLRRAELCLRAEVPQEALRDLVEARKHGARPPPALSARIEAEAHFRAEEWKEAAQAYQVLLGLDPRPADSALLEARLETAQRYASGAVLLR